MGTLNDKLNYLAGTKAAIKTAITGKGVTVADNDTFRSYAEKISVIETGVDTSDATAGALDIATGKTAYVGGQKITGQVSVVNASSLENLSFDQITGGAVSVSILGKAPYDILCREGASLVASAPYTSFGNATAADVAAGKTFTSAAGLNVVGTSTANSNILNTFIETHGIIPDGSVSAEGNFIIYPPDNDYPALIYYCLFFKDVASYFYMVHLGTCLETVQPVNILATSTQIQIGLYLPNADDQVMQIDCMGADNYGGVDLSSLRLLYCPMN